MILSRPDILKALKSKNATRRLCFDPPVDHSRVEQVSVDLLLGRQFTRFKKDIPAFIDAVRIDPSIWDAEDIWEEEEADEYKLGPNEFVLAQTLEVVTIPSNLVGLVEGKSTNARLGLSIHLTAPKIDPGFHGPITLEITNLGGLTLKLRAGIDLLAQLMFLRISTPLKKHELYGAASGHIFQGQTRPIPRKRRR